MLTVHQTWETEESTDQQRWRESDGLLILTGSQITPNNNQQSPTTIHRAASIVLPGLSRRSNAKRFQSLVCSATFPSGISVNTIGLTQSRVSFAYSKWERERERSERRSIGHSLSSIFPSFSTPRWLVCGRPLLVHPSLIHPSICPSCHPLAAPTASMLRYGEEASVVNYASNAKRVTWPSRLIVTYRASVNR